MIIMIIIAILALILIAAGFIITHLPLLFLIAAGIFAWFTT